MRGTNFFLTDGQGPLQEEFSVPMATLLLIQRYQIVQALDGVGM